MLDDEDAGEISLAENVVRLPMHPADQYDAFKAMADKGRGHEEIATRFGCTATVVKQRLKLASVSPRLIDAYRAEEMTRRAGSTGRTIGGAGNVGRNRRRRHAGQREAV